MIYRLVLVYFLSVSNIFASEYFMELLLGMSLDRNKIETSLTNPDFSIYNSSDTATTQFEARLGYSFYMSNSFYLEPSIGLGYLKSFSQDIDISPLYSIEVPVLYKVNAFKYGLLLKYNYYPEISAEAIYDSVKFKNKSSVSVGAKILLVGSIVDLILKYEYLMNGIYEDKYLNSYGKTTTKVNLEGGYISAGLRFKF